LRSTRENEEEHDQALALALMEKNAECGECVAGHANEAFWRVKQDIDESTVGTTEQTQLLDELRDAVTAAEEHLSELCKVSTQQISRCKR